jgi:hypothetical protein
MGVFIGGEDDRHRKLEDLDGQAAIHMAGRPTFSTFTDFGHHRPTPPTSLDMCMKQFSKIRKTLGDRPSKWGRPTPLWLGWARALCLVIPSCHIVYDFVLFRT